MINTKPYPGETIELHGERKSYKDTQVEIFQHLMHVLRVYYVSDLY